MAVTLPEPVSANEAHQITLAGKNYEFYYRFNNRDNGGQGRWRVTLSLGGVVIKAGVKIMEDQGLFNRFALDDFWHGEVLCLGTGAKPYEVVGRNNLGPGKAFELVYVTNEEYLEALNA